MSNIEFWGPVEPESGHGFRRTTGNTLSDLAVVSKGKVRLEFGNYAITEGNRTSAALMGAGTTSQPVECGTTNKNFLGFWVKSSSTSGDNRGLYMRLYMDGTSGASGEAVRAYTTVEAGGVAAAAHGAHLSLDFATTGYCSGLGCASRSTLHIPAQASWSTGGTYTAVQAEIYSDGTASDAAGVTELSYIRCCNDGHANGIADVDDDAFLLVYAGGTTAGSNLVEASTTEANYSLGARCKLNGTTCYMMFASAAG